MKKKVELDIIYRDIHRNEVLLSEYYSLTKTIIPNLSLDIHQLEKLILNELILKTKIE